MGWLFSFFNVNQQQFLRCSSLWLMIRLTSGHCSDTTAVTAQASSDSMRKWAKTITLCQSHLTGKDPLHSSQTMSVEHRNPSSCCCSANTPAGSQFHPPLEKMKHLAQKATSPDLFPWHKTSGVNPRFLSSQLYILKLWKTQPPAPFSISWLKQQLPP